MLDQTNAIHKIVEVVADKLDLRDLSKAPSVIIKPNPQGITYNDLLEIAITATDAIYA